MNAHRRYHCVNCNTKTERRTYCSIECHDAMLDKRRAELSDVSGLSGGRISYRQTASQAARNVKTCSSCKLEQDSNNFGQSSSGRLSSRCKICVKKANQQVSAHLPKRAKFLQDKSKSLVKAYGITIIQYWMILDRQGGTCATCSAIENLHVDHCHESLVVRGILCGACNRGVGCFYDNPDTLRRAAQYLEQARVAQSGRAPA